MPNETKQAVEWAKKQCIESEFGKMCVVEDGEINPHLLVDFVRKYFNEHNIEYDMFSYDDLIPYLN